MTDMMTYSLLRKFQRSKDFVEQFRIILSLARMYNIKIDYELANEVIVNLPFAIEVREELKNSVYAYKLPQKVSENLKNAEEIFRECIKLLHQKAKIPVQVL